MKRLLLFCSLCAVTFSSVFAQDVTPQKLMTQSEFTGKVKLLDAAFKAKNTDKINSAFGEITQMMDNEFHAEKMKLHEPATTDAYKSEYAPRFQKQYSIYQEVLNMRNDIAGNHAALDTKLAEYAKTLK